jgi:hypothetical protein
VPDRPDDRGERFFLHPERGIGALAITGVHGRLDLRLKSIVTLPQAAGDMSLWASVVSGDFVGGASAWIDRPSWDAFLAQLGELEHTLSGSAAVESMSPGELVLEIAATRPTAPLLVRGQVARTSSAGLDHLLRFGFELNPSALPELLRQARSFAPFPLDAPPR